MENIFERLREDHDKQRRLLASILNTSGESEMRQASFRALVLELKEHAKYEERVLYQPLIEDDRSQDKARHSISEHHEIDEQISTLKDIDMSSPAWLKAAKKLNELVEHHLKEEEHGLFQLAGRVLSQNEKKEAAKEFSDMRAG